MSMATQDKPAGEAAPQSKSHLWRTIWAIVFVVLSIEAILIAALINSRREVVVTRPIINVAGEKQLSLDRSRIAAYLNASWVYEDVNVRFFTGGTVGLNPGAYLEALRSDYEFIAKFAGLTETKLPANVYFFGDELKTILAGMGIESGWVEGEALFVPAGGSAVKPLLEFACAKAGVKPDGDILLSVSSFLGEFLDFYNDHPYENAFSRSYSKWQRDTQIALPVAQVLLDDQRLGPDFISLPARDPLIIEEGTLANEVLRRGFYRYLLSKSGWDGFSRLLLSGKPGGEAFEAAFGEPLPVLLKEYQESLDLMPRDVFTITQAKLDALDMGLFTYTPAAQIIGDSEWALKEESKRFRLPPRDLAERQAALGKLHMRKFFAALDPNSPEAKRYLADAQSILLSPKSISGELVELEHKWLLGKAYERQGDYETSDRFFAAGLESKDTRPDYLGEYSRILVERRNFQHASDILGEYLVRNPADARALYLRMSTLNRIGFTSAAAALAEKLLSHPAIELGNHPDWESVAKYIMQSASASPERIPENKAKSDSE